MCWQYSPEPWAATIRPPSSIRQIRTLRPDPTVAELAEEPDIGSPRVVAQFQVPSGDHWFGTDRFGRDICAGGAITLLVMAFNLLGDALRDVLDPRLRGI